RARSLNDLLQYGHGKMRLPHPRLAFQKQSAADHGKGFGKSLRLSGGALQGLVVRREVRESAVLIPFRDACLGQPFASQPVAPAVAAPHAARPGRGIVASRFPAGIVTQRTGHRSKPSVRVAAKLRRVPQLLFRPRLNLSDALAREMQPIANLLERARLVVSQSET